MRLIDAEELIKDIDTYIPDDVNPNDLYTAGIFDAEQVIIGSKEVDAIPVSDIKALADSYYDEGIEPCDLERLLAEHKNGGEADKKKEGHWIKVTSGPITDEDREVGLFTPDMIYQFTCPMPEDGQVILITIDGDEPYVWVDTNYIDEDGCYRLESDLSWVDDVIAWMPLPEPYKGVE